MAREAQLPVGRVLGVFLIFPPTVLSIAGGNYAAPITVCLTRAWLANRHQRDLSAGIWLGVAIVGKPFLLPFIGYAAVQQRWRMCVGLLTGMVAALLIGVAAFGVRNTSLWIRTLRTLPPPHFLTYHLNGSWMS